MDITPESFDHKEIISQLDNAISQWDLKKSEEYYNTLKKFYQEKLLALRGIHNQKDFLESNIKDLDVSVRLINTFNALKTDTPWDFLERFSTEAQFKEANPINSIVATTKELSKLFKEKQIQW